MISKCNICLWKYNKILKAYFIPFQMRNSLFCCCEYFLSNKRGRGPVDFGCFRASTQSVSAAVRSMSFKNRSFLTFALRLVINFSTRAVILSSFETSLNRMLSMIFDKLVPLMCVVSWTKFVVVVVVAVLLLILSSLRPSSERYVVSSIFSDIG